jgi:CheY-like chemotaxis protein
MAIVVLASGGADITHAADGEECLAQRGNHRYDLLFLDLIMPKIDGFGVLQAVRADPGLRARLRGCVYRRAER